MAEQHEFSLGFVERNAGLGTQSDSGSEIRRTNGTQPTCSNLCGYRKFTESDGRRRTNSRPSRLQRLDFTRPVNRGHVTGRWLTWVLSVSVPAMRSNYTLPERLDRCQSHAHSLVDARRNIWTLQVRTTQNCPENNFFLHVKIAKPSSRLLARLETSPTRDNNYGDTSNRPISFERIKYN
jgi:hypothetical protein